MKILLTIFCLMNLSSSAFAGWASGGGKIHRDSLNPWFLENTKEVKVCVDVDEAQFGVSQARAEELAKWAIGEWKRGFDLAPDDYYTGSEKLEPYGQIRVATQIFKWFPCSANVDFDLRFQFGTLTPKQADIFADPKEYVGIAFRTEYDIENLRGKGFIYIAPTKGPLKPILETMHADAWSIGNNSILKGVLLHELGHIFGIPHSSDTLMDENMPEFIVQKKLINDLITVMGQLNIPTLTTIDSVFGIDRVRTNAGCKGSNPIASSRVFGISWDRLQNSCGKVVLNNGRLTVHESGSINGPWNLVADSKLVNGGGSYTSTEPLVRVYLSEKQKVFNKLPPETLFDYSQLHGETRVEKRVYTGHLKVLNGLSSYLTSITIEESNVEVTAVKNGKFIRDILFFKY